MSDETPQVPVTTEDENTKPSLEELLHSLALDVQKLLQRAGILHANDVHPVVAATEPEAENTDSAGN